MLTNHQTYLNDIQVALREIEKNNHPNEYCKKAILYLEELRFKINEWLRTYDFPNEEEEIHFFKVLKPQLSSKIIYYKKRHEIQLRTPSSQKAKYKYYVRQLDKNSQKLNNLKSFSRYIRSKLIHRDQEYFLRKNNTSDFNNQYQLMFIDERTTTKMEFALSTIIAKEKIIKYLENKLEEFKKATNTSYPVSNLKWTGSKVEIIELIYAVNNRNVINDGNIDIREVAIGFEKLLNIELVPYIYDTYRDIKERKSGPTKFIDSLSVGLKNKCLCE